MDDDEVLFVAGMAAAVVTVIASSRLDSAGKRKRHTTWVRPLFQRRSEYCAYNLLMAELRKSDTDIRLTVKDFDELLSIVKSI